MKNKLSFWLLILNIVLLGIGPVIILILLAVKSGSFPVTPVWANGLFIAWAMTINLWVGLGFLFEQNFSPIYSKFFLVTNFLLPLGISFSLKSSLWLTLYEITTFHFLSLALAVAILMLFGPFVKLEGKNGILGAIGWMFFGTVIFGYFLSLPAIWCEMVLWQEVSSAWNTDWTNQLWLGMRYFGVFLNTSVLLSLLFEGSVYR